MTSNQHHTVTVDYMAETIFGRFIGTGQQGIDVGDLLTVNTSAGAGLARALIVHELTELYESTDGNIPGTTPENHQSIFEGLHTKALAAETNLGFSRTGEAYDPNAYNWPNTGKGWLKYGDSTLDFQNKKGSFTCKWR